MNKLKQKVSTLIPQKKSGNWDKEVRCSSSLCITAPPCLPGEDSEQGQVVFSSRSHVYWAWSPPQSSSLESNEMSPGQCLKAYMTKRVILSFLLFFEAKGQRKDLELARQVFCHWTKSPVSIKQVKCIPMGAELPNPGLSMDYFLHSRTLENFWMIFLLFSHSISGIESPTPRYKVHGA